MRYALFLCQFLILVEEEVFIEEDELPVLEQVWVGMSICIFGGLRGCSLIHVLGSFSG